MKARILPLDDIAEFGKKDSVVLLVSMTPEEARMILERIEDPTGLEDEPRPVRLLIGYLKTIAGNHSTSDQFAQEMVNTDGRCGVSSSDRIPNFPGGIF